MRPSWSSTWDALIIRAVREQRPDLLRDGRRISVWVTSVVLSFLSDPDRAVGAIEAASAADRNYLAQYLSRALDRRVAGGVWDDEFTDPCRFRNLRRGIVAMKEAGWDARLRNW